MKVITLSQTKALLGITDPSQDSDITAKIPFIDSIVKQITKNRFNFMILGDIESGSPFMTVQSIITPTGETYVYNQGDRRYYCSGINNPYIIDDINEYLEIGQQVEGEGIPVETHIDEVYYNGDILSDTSGDFSVPVVKLSNNATATTASLRVYVGMNIAYQPTVAKGIQYLINGTSTTLPSNALSSKSIGPASKSFAQVDQKIDNRYGMPAWFVKAFPKFHRGH
jgi:hypothetical protein